ncbi:MAG: helix-turn-helix transcriptional regulator [Ruminococcaceae bacterium]|nr:helix-turn-helix transcriptional regulator [Oscillospiraceae bacterium]
MDIAKIGNFIKELRKEKGYTQKELAEKLHITDRAVSKWERGLSAPDLPMLRNVL